MPDVSLCIWLLFLVPPPTPKHALECGKKLCGVTTFVLSRAEQQGQVTEAWQGLSGGAASAEVH